MGKGVNAGIALTHVPPRKNAEEHAKRRRCILTRILIISLKPHTFFSQGGTPGMQLLFLHTSPACETRNQKLNDGGRSTAVRVLPAGISTSQKILWEIPFEKMTDSKTAGRKCLSLTLLSLRGQRMLR